MAARIARFNKVSFDQFMKDKILKVFMAELNCLQEQQQDLQDMTFVRR